MTEFHVTVTYQYMENYGAHTWDGEGACPQHWKCKGGSDEVVAVLTATEVTDLGTEGLEALVRENANEWRNEASEQYIIGWSLETIDTDLLVRVRDALAEEREYWADDPYIYMAVAINLRISESLAKLAIERLDDPNLVLPVEEVDSPWEDFAEAA